MEWGSVHVKLCFLVVCVRCDVLVILCLLFITDDVFVLRYIELPELHIFTERDDQCGNQHHSRELLMMGIVVAETC